MNSKFYQLPELPYPPDALEPIISHDQLLLHHDKHHQSYVDNANDLLKKIEESRTDGESVDVGVVAKKLSFNVGGHVLHSLFWQNLTPPDQFKEVQSSLQNDLESEYGSIERFRSEFFDCATTVEGSGWAVLSYDEETDRLIISQVGNHNLNISPLRKIVLVLDMWEHAYYLDYRNDKKKFANNFWQLVNWQEIQKRYEAIKAGD